MSWSGAAVGTAGGRGDATAWSRSCEFGGVWGGGAASCKFGGVLLGGVPARTSGGRTSTGGRIDDLVVFNRGGDSPTYYLSNYMICIAMMGLASLAGQRAQAHCRTA